MEFGLCLNDVVVWFGLAELLALGHRPHASLVSRLQHLGNKYPGLLRDQNHATSPHSEASVRTSHVHSSQEYTHVKVYNAISCFEDLTLICMRMSPSTSLVLIKSKKRKIENNGVGMSVLSILGL